MNVVAFERIWEQRLEPRNRAIANVAGAVSDQRTTGGIEAAIRFGRASLQILVRIADCHHARVGPGRNVRIPPSVQLCRVDQLWTVGRNEGYFEMSAPRSKIPCRHNPILSKALFIKSVPLFDVAILEVCRETTLPAVNRGIHRISARSGNKGVYYRTGIRRVADVVIELANNHSLRVRAVGLSCDRSRIGLRAIEARAVIESRVGRNVRYAKTAAHNC